MNDVEIAGLRREVAQLRTEIDQVDDWAHGLYGVLVDVLPFLLRGHPEADRVRQLLQHRDDHYAALLADPSSAEDGECAAQYEAAKMLNRQLAVLGAWPDVDPVDAARQALEEAGWRGGA